RGGRPASVEGSPASVEGSPASVEGGSRAWRSARERGGQPASVEGSPASAEGSPQAWRAARERGGQPCSRDEPLHGPTPHWELHTARASRLQAARPARKPLG